MFDGETFLISTIRFSMDGAQISKSCKHFTISISTLIILLKSNALVEVMAKRQTIKANFILDILFLYYSIIYKNL